jgi:hypothetical protein
VPEHVLLVVAVRTDLPIEVKRRIATILAATGTYAEPPDTTAAAWAKSESEITEQDLEHLRHFATEPGIELLNLDTGSEAS